MIKLTHYKGKLGYVSFPEYQEVIIDEVELHDDNIDDYHFIVKAHSGDTILNATFKFTVLEFYTKFLLDNK